jgi:hypothetical protein
MSRYLTRRYATVTWIEALRLALLDQTPIEEIRCSPQVELVHRTEWWAWWSDEVLTVAIGLPEELQPQALTPDAVELIDDVFLSDTPQPQCGWATLAHVQRILRIERIVVQQSGVTNRLGRWEELAVEFHDGRQEILYRLWIGFEEGYWCDIRVEPPEE